MSQQIIMGGPDEPPTGPISKKLLALFLVCLSIMSITGFELLQMTHAGPAPTINSTCEPGGCASGMSYTYSIYKDPSGPTFLASKSAGGGNTYSETTVSAVLNDVIPATDTAGGGAIYVHNMGTITIAQWGTALVTLKQTVALQFEHAGTFNINTVGDIFAGTDANGRYNLDFDSVFNVYGSTTNFLHLSNAIESNIYIYAITSGSGSIIAGTKAVYLDGNPAYYNKIKINLADTMDTVIHFPKVIVGANDNQVLYVTCNKVNYCVKIDNGVSDNQILRMDIGSGGIVTGGTNAGLYIDGFSNTGLNIQGEYSIAGFVGPLVYLDSHAIKNNVWPIQEGTAATLTDAASTHSNLIQRWPPPASLSRSITAGASPYTYTNVDNMKETFTVTAQNGMTTLTCNTIAINVKTNSTSPVLNPADSCVFTWATSAPTFYVMPTI